MIATANAGPATEALVLLAHGSLDPAAQESTRALARAITMAQPLPVEIAYLRHARPRMREVLGGLVEAGCRRVTVVPLLLTMAHHAQVDVPRALAARADLPLRVTATIGGQSGAPDSRLVAALTRRLTELDVGFDAVVVSAAGSSDTDANASVTAVAVALATELRVPCQAAFVARADPDPGAAVALLRRAGARRVVVATYCLAPGRLYDRATAAATAAGAVGICAPLGDAPELVRLIVDHLAIAGLPSPRVAASRLVEQLRVEATGSGWSAWSGSALNR
jgi:sirohydrochlorin ferrochelatase